MEMRVGNDIYLGENKIRHKDRQMLTSSKVYVKDLKEIVDILQKIKSSKRKLDLWLIGDAGI